MIDAVGSDRRVSQLPAIGRHRHVKIHTAGQCGSRGLKSHRIRRRPPHFGQAEIEHLHSAAGFDLDVARLEIAMYDVLFVRGRQRCLNLLRNGQCLAQRKRSLLDSFGKGFAFDQLHHQVVRSDVVERANVGVIQRCNRSRFTLEPLAEPFGGNLDCDFAMEPRVGRHVHLAHPARADGPQDLVNTKLRSRVETHPFSLPFGGSLPQVETPAPK